MSEESYMTRRPTAEETARLTVLSGCSGGGKSSLLKELARRGHAVRPEPGRQIVREQTLIDGPGLPWKDLSCFVDLCLSRATHFHATAVAEARRTIFDRSVVDAVAALERAGLAVAGHHRRIVERLRYARTVFLVPPWQELFEQDGERQHDFGVAVAEYEHLLTAYPAAGYDVEIVPKGPLAERADFIEARLA